MIDLDRLHGVAGGQLRGRGVGHTYYYCHLIAGIVELGNQLIYIILPHYNWFKHFKIELARVFLHHGLTLIEKNNDLISGTSIIKMHDKEDFEKLRGLSHDGVFVMAYHPDEVD